MSYERCCTFVPLFLLGNLCEEMRESCCFVLRGRAKLQMRSVANILTFLLDASSSLIGVVSQQRSWLGTAVARNQLRAARHA